MNADPLKMGKVALIGTGIMGKEMALKLLESGNQVTVCDHTEDKARPVIAAGASFVESPADAVEDADFILSMVGDDEDSREVWLGKKGVIHGIYRNGAVAVECSTLSHGWVLRLRDELAAIGLHFADCPVTGGPDGARAGALTILAGGEEHVIDALRPLFSAFAREVIHFGPLGSGTSYKLIVNLLGAVQAAGLGEALVLAERAGLDLEKVGYALKKSAVASRYINYLVDRMLAGNHDEVYFSARWRHKDAAYALTLASEQNLKLITSAAATEVFRRSVERGLGDKNSSVIIELIRQEVATARR